MLDWKNLGARLGSVFVATAVPNVGVGAALGVDVWKSAVMSGVIAVLAVVQKLAAAYRDGKLTAAEVDEAFGDA